MSRFLIAGTIIILALAAEGFAQEPSLLACQFAEEQGLVSAAYGGEGIIKDGQIRVLGVRLQQRSTDEKTGQWKYTETHLKAPEGERVFDAASRTLSLRYEWGEVSAQYKPENDRLTVEVSIKNATQQQYISGFWLDLMRLSLPDKRETNEGIGQLQRAVDMRIVQASSFGNQLMVMAYESLETPLALWIDKPKEEEEGYPLKMTGGIPLPEANEYYVHGGGRPAIAPGQTLVIRFSLRFAPGGTPVPELVKDIDETMRKLHGAGPVWKDRRPIAMLIASAAELRAANNPRGWFNDKTLDITTDAGRAKFRADALAYAERSAKILKDMNAQGGIVWDIEGSENPHPVTYIGDPRLTEKLAPEMDAVADEFFRKFSDAGLRTGVCLRPSRVYFDEKTKKWAHNPGNAWPAPTEYESIKPKEVARHLFYPIASRISDKIAYAKKRWGCTIFYIDTNYVGQWFGEDTDKKLLEFPLTAAMYREILKDHPDVLLIPEHWKGCFGQQEATWAYAAPYMELDLGGTGTPARMRHLFPGAFSIVNVVDGPIEGKREKLLEAVKEGDILLFRGWFNDKKRNEIVKELYLEAAGKAIPALEEVAPTKGKNP